MSYEVNDFEQDVIENSSAAPVVVDFWAEWCGPCKALAPVLEKLAAEAEGRWSLVKVDVDANPTLAAQFQVRGIPAVMLVVDGQVTAQFSGALPEADVRQWLENSLPSEGDRIVKDAETLLADSNPSAAIALLETLLETEPDNFAARTLLARQILFTQPQRALELVEPVHLGDDRYDAAAAVRQICTLRLRNRGDFPDSPAREAYLQAIELIGEAKIEQAIRAFLQCLLVDRDYDDQGSRVAAIALLEWLDDPDLVRSLRRQLQSALH